MPAHLHRDGVDEERHVLDDRLDDRVRGLPAVLLEARRVDVRLELAGPADARETPVRERRPGEVELAPVDQVLRRDVRVVGADEPLHVGRLGVLGGVAGARGDRLQESHLRLVRARRHSVSLPALKYGPCPLAEAPAPRLASQRLPAAARRVGLTVPALQKE